MREKLDKIHSMCEQLIDDLKVLKSPSNLQILIIERVEQIKELAAPDPAHAIYKEIVEK